MCLPIFVSTVELNLLLIPCRYLVRCAQGALFPSETYLSRLEDLVSSRNSQHSLKKFGGDTFTQDANAKQDLYEDIA